MEGSGFDRWRPAEGRVGVPGLADLAACTSEGSGSGARGVASPGAAGRFVPSLESFRLCRLATDATALAARVAGLVEEDCNPRVEPPYPHLTTAVVMGILTRC